MLSYLIVFSILNVLLAFDPPCTSCKFYIPHKGVSSGLGLCKIFTTNASPNSNVITPLPNFAVHCRNNENLCGKSGFLYEMKDAEKIFEDIEDIKNSCCGEVNETDELEQFDGKLQEILEKIKKHNKKRVYNSVEDLYKLLKK